MNNTMTANEQFLFLFNTGFHWQIYDVLVHLLVICWLVIDCICLHFLKQSVNKWNAFLVCLRQLDFRRCRAPASSLDFSVGFLIIYKAILFLEHSEGGVSRIFQENQMAVGKSRGVEWSHRLFITNKFHLWSLCSPWEWKVPLELYVVFLHSTELSHWNFLSCICVSVKLNAMAEQEAASFLRSKLKHTRTQPWFCVLRMGANLPPYLSPGFLTSMPWPINDFSVIIFIKVFLV